MAVKLGVSYPAISDQFGLSNIPSNILRNTISIKEPRYGTIDTFTKVGVAGSSVTNSVLSLTSAGMLGMLAGDIISKAAVSTADYLTDGGTSQALLELSKKKTSSSSPADTVSLPDSVLNPYAPSQFTYNEENSPALLTGTMQSAEMICLTLASLIQITADNHTEYMKVLGADIQLRYRNSDRIATSLEALVPIMLGNVETLNVVESTLQKLNNNGSIVESGNAVASAIANQPPASAHAINNVDVSPIVEALSKSDNSFRQTYVPTGEFWARADSASLKYDSLVGANSSFVNLPSASFLVGEVSLISSLVDSGKNQSQIIAEIETYRKSHLSSGVYALTMYSDDPFNSQDDLNKSMKNYYDNALNNSIPEATVSMSQSLADIAAWSQKAKTREEFLQTEQDIRDSDGDIIASSSPMQLSAEKDAQHKKHLDDKNTFKMEEGDFISPLDSLPLVGFIGRESVFDMKTSVPSDNPFLSRLKSLFPNLF